LEIVNERENEKYAKKTASAEEKAARMRKIGIAISVILVVGVIYYVISNYTKT